MALVKICLVFALVAAATASPTDPSFWKDTFLDGTVEEMRSMCNDDDALACIKFKAMSFLDNLFKKDNYKISEDIEVSRNSFRSNDVSSRGSASLEENLQEYIQTHDVSLKLPVVGSVVTLGARNIDSDEVSLKLKFNEGVEPRGRSRLRKILVPIMVFVLLKAITLIPLAIGMLGLKAWNALQLSFFSFIVSVSLAVFQLCKKIAVDHSQPQIAAHTPWEASYAQQYAARSLDDAAQDLAYSAYTQ